MATRAPSAPVKLSRNPLPLAALKNFGGSVNVAADVKCLQLSLVNVFLVGAPQAADRQWVLVDAGVALSAGAIRSAARKRFGNGSRPAAIILTHGHFDHIGAVETLAKEWDAPVYAHELELPYLTGRSSYPPPDPAVGGGGMSFLSRLYPRGPINLGKRVRRLPADGTVPGMTGWRWIHTPGHTAGHVSLFRDEDRVLIAGDAFVTAKQESALGALLKQPTEVRRPPAYYTSDWDAARESVSKLLRLEPHIAATGHGMPMSGESLRHGLAELVTNWEAVARPLHGRYIHSPAFTDERGVISVPPAVRDPSVPHVVLIAIAAALGMSVMWRPSGKKKRRKSKSMPKPKTARGQA